MSHFSVMVIGDNIEHQLAPYNENMEVSIDVTDKLEEKAKEIVKFTTWVDERSIYHGDGEVGEIHVFDHMEGSPRKVIEEGTMLHVFGTIKEIAEYYGYKFENDAWTSNYNPDSKWDWWQIGGRWRNMLTLVDNPKYPDKIVKGDMGVPELFAVREGKADHEPENKCDAAAFCDIDWEAMAEKRRNDAIIRLERFLSNNPMLREGMTNDEFKAITDKTPVIDAMYLWGKDHVPTRQEVENEAYALTTYALVKDCIWYEKGEMGWFGISRNEKTCCEWQELFEKVIDGIPEDTTVTIVDCHI